MYVVKWKDSEIRGYDDHIPENSIKRSSPELDHAILGPKGWMRIARCAVIVDGNQVTFDYEGEHLSWNKGRDFYIGKMMFKFNSSQRKGLPQLLWKGEGEDKFEKDLGHVELKNIPKQLERGRNEGGKRLKTHLESERYPAARREKLIDELERKKKIICEVCKIDFTKKYGPDGYFAYEVHHKRAIKAGERTTSLSDLAILCANCHNVIHASDPIKSVAAMAATFRKRVA